MGLLGAGLEIHAHRGHVRDAIGELRLGRLLGAEGVAGGAFIRGLVGVALLRIILGEVLAGHRGEVEDGRGAVGKMIGVLDEVDMHGRQAQDDLGLNAPGHRDFLGRPQGERASLKVPDGQVLIQPGRRRRHGVARHVERRS